jgi:hypothetical protein
VQCSSKSYSTFAAGLEEWWCSTSDVRTLGTNGAGYGISHYQLSLWLLLVVSSELVVIAYVAVTLLVA